MAVAAQFVKLLFDQIFHRLVRFVTIKAHTETSGVHVVVVASDTALLDVVSVGKSHGQHGSLRMRYAIFVGWIMTNPLGHEHEYEKYRGNEQGKSNKPQGYSPWTKNLITTMVIGISHTAHVAA